MQNPFVNVGYRSPLYFCDREEELSRLIEAIKDRRSLTLHSIRRIGKTGMIHHLFHHLEKQPRKFLTTYLDIFDTKTSADFVNALVTSVLATLEKKESRYVKRVTSFFGRYRPQIMVDQLTGNPSLTLDIRDEKDVVTSLDTLFEMVGESKKRVVIAIDEFQQINAYPDSRMAATLRKHLQQTSNVVFIFSGSEQHLLLEMFSSPQRALFSMTQIFPLDAIDESAYAEFIQFHFKQGLRRISDHQIKDILEWTARHTYYTQTFCQRLYSRCEKTVHNDDVEAIKLNILKEQEAAIHSYRSLLTKAQWNLWVAIAKEGTVTKPTASGFLREHNLGSHGTVRQALAALIKYQLVYLVYEDKVKMYRVYNAFFRRWLEYFG